jgi:hypothetical protein
LNEQQNKQTSGIENVGKFLFCEAKKCIKHFSHLRSFASYKKKHFVSLTETALIPIKGHKKFCAKNGTQNDSYIF